MSYNPQNPNGQATSANSSPVVIASDQSAVSVNAAQVAGTAVDTNSGVKSAGTQRIVIATDQPQLTNALKVDGSAVTQPVDTELPAAAALADSAANPTTSTVGSATSIWDNNGSTWNRQRSVFHGQNSTGTGIAASGVLAEFDDTSPSAVTENQFAPLRMSSNRNLYGTIRDAAGNERGANVTASNALVVDGSAATQPVAGNVASAATDSGNPVKVAGKYNATPPTFTDGQRGDMQLDSSGNLKVNVANSVTVGTHAVTQSGTWTVQPGNTANTTSWNVNLAPSASGGWSASSQTNLTTTATVSSAAGKFGGYMFINLNSTPAYIQVFDTTGAVTLGTTTPTFVVPIPANSTAANGAGANLEMTNGIAITNGIKVAATTTATGATTVTTGLTGYVLYK